MLNSLYPLETKTSPHNQECRVTPGKWPLLQPGKENWAEAER